MSADHTPTSRTYAVAGKPRSHILALCNALEHELAEANRALANASTWIPVGERLPERRWLGDEDPKDSVEVLFVDADGYIWTGHYEPYANGDWWACGAERGGYVSGVTHWMPLPERP